MTMQYDVLSAHVEATGTMVSGRVRVKGYQCLSGGTAGDIIFRDGGASGTIRLQFNIPANTNNPFSNLIPGEGILFSTDVHVTLPTAAKVTVLLLIYWSSVPFIEESEPRKLHGFIRRGQSTAASECRHDDRKNEKCECGSGYDSSNDNCRERSLHLTTCSV